LVSTKLDTFCYPTVQTAPLVDIPTFRIRLCVRTYRCLNGTAPPYLAESICRVADTQITAPSVG